MTTMTPELFAGKTYTTCCEDVPIQVLGDDAEIFVALGCPDYCAMADAAWKAFLEANGDPHVERFSTSDVIRRWAVLEPQGAGAVGDEWQLRWVDADTEGAFPVSTVEA